jgi:multidrug efflux pump subunit AcrA (membrane-fusion protein)
MTIADLSTVWVSAEVPEPSVRLIHVGEPVSISFLSFPDESFTGKVTRIGDVLDPQTRTLKVYVVLSNPQGRLRPEMFGSVRLLGLRARFRRPPTAIIQEYGQALVFVEQNRVSSSGGSLHRGARRLSRGGLSGVQAGDGDHRRRGAPEGSVAQPSRVAPRPTPSVFPRRRLLAWSPDWSASRGSAARDRYGRAGARRGGRVGVQPTQDRGLPDLTDPTVVVVTVYPGFAAEEVEQQVTVPIGAP